MARKYSRRLRKRTGRRRMRGGAEQAVFPAPVENASYESSLSSPSKMMLAQGNEYASLHAGQHGGAAAINLAPAPPGFTGILDNSLRPQAWVGPLDASIQAIQGMSDVQGGGRRKGSRRKGSRRKGSRRKGSRRMRGGSTGTPASNSTKSSTGTPASNVKKNANKAHNSNKGRNPNKGNNPNKGRNPNKSRNFNSSRRNNRGSTQRNAPSRTPVPTARGGAYTLSHAQEFSAPGMLLSPAQQAAALNGMSPDWKTAQDPTYFTPNR